MRMNETGETITAKPRSQGGNKPCFVNSKGLAKYDVSCIQLFTLGIAAEECLYFLCLDRRTNNVKVQGREVRLKSCSHLV